MKEHETDVGDRMPGHITLPLQILQATYFFLLLAGGLSLERIGMSDFGSLGEIRFSLLMAVLAGVMLLAASKTTRLVTSQSVWMWLFAFVLLHAWVMISWFWSVQSASSGAEAQELSLLAITVLAGMVVIGWGPRSAGSVLVVTVYFLGVVFLGASVLLGGGITGDLAMIGAGGIGAGRLMALAIVAAVYQTIRSDRLVWLVPVPVMLLLILLSGSRASLLALAVAIGVLVWRRDAIRRLSGRGIQGWRRLLMWVLGVALPLLIAFSESGQDALNKYLISSFITQNELKPGTLYFAGRDIIFADALEYSFRHPLAGVGIGTYIGPFGERYPHNLVLGYAVDSGWIAALLCLALMVVAFWRLVRCKDALIQCILGFAVLNLVIAMFSGSYFDYRLLWATLLLGLVVVDHRPVNWPRQGSHMVHFGRLHFAQKRRAGNSAGV